MFHYFGSLIQDKATYDKLVLKLQWLGTDESKSVYLITLESVHGTNQY